MAITWNQIADPNFTQSNALLTRGQDLWAKAAQGLGQTAQDFAQAKETQNTNQLMDLMYQAKDPNAFKDANFQNSLAAMRDSFGPNYDVEKYRMAMDNRLGKLQQDAVSAMAFQDKEDAQYNQPLLRQYYQDMQEGNTERANGILKQMRGNSAQYIPQGMDLFKAQHDMTNQDAQLELSRDSNNLQWQKFGFEQDEADRNYNLKLGELNAPTGQYSIDPKTGDIIYEETGGGGYSGGGSGAMPASVRQGIFRGESGGDYNALLNFSNQKGGQFSNVRLTDMTVDQAIKFSSAGGAYANYSKAKTGKVATPMGAYQIVGSTLREAKKAMGLKGNERMTPQMQDALGDYIYQTQGTGAWVGYKGRASGGGGYKKGATTPLAAARQTKAETALNASGYALKADQKYFTESNIAALDEKVAEWGNLQKSLPMNHAQKDYRSIGDFRNKVGRGQDILTGFKQAGFTKGKYTEQQLLNMAVSFNQWVQDNKVHTKGVFGGVRSWGGVKGPTHGLSGEEVIAAARAYAQSNIKANNTYTTAISSYKKRSAHLTRNFNTVTELNASNNRR